MLQVITDRRIKAPWGKERRPGGKIPGPHTPKRSENKIRSTNISLELVAKRDGKEFDDTKSSAWKTWMG
jgi:hypothetical protein